MILEIYRSGTPNLEINIAADGIAVFTRSLMGEHKIVCQFSTPEPVDLKKGDYITHEGIKFTLNIPAEIDRSGQRFLKYSCTFESPLYSMYSKVFMNNGAADFDYNGATPTEMVQLLIENMNEIDPGWTVGEIEAGITIGTQDFTFSNVKCRDAINTIAEQFGLEWNLDNKKVNLIKKIGNETTLRFQYGKGLGLYQLKRQNVDDKNIVTKLYVFGGNRNIDYKYRDGAKRLIFSEKFLTKNLGLYGLEEGVQTFEDIYPKREGKVTATADPNTVTDSTLDFDINAQLLGGIPAKISFLDGDLAGVTFEIAKNGYDHATKTIKFNSFTSDAGLKYPSPDENLIPRVGDTYILLDIKMPASYVTAAENLLKTKGQEYLDENSVPRVQYGLTIDPINAKKKGIRFNVGDRVQVLDPDLGINEKIRVTAISYPLYNPFQITATIADSVGYTLAQRLISKQIDNEKQIGYVDQRRSEDYRRAYAQQQLLRDSIFDPDGYFDPENIRPESIETLMLSVGAKSQAFQLSGAYIKIANDNASFTATACKLIHNNLEIEGLGYTWVLAPWSQDLPDPSETYYLYALCSKTALVGTWAADPAKHNVEDIPGYYTLLVGVIYPVVDGYRGMSLTYGYASINGRTITAGRIQSLDGRNYNDLDTDQLNVGNPDGNGFDYNVSIPNDFVFRGGIVQREPGVAAPIPVYRGQWYSAATYFPGDTVKYNGQTYTYIGTESSTGHLPTDTTYWEISASQGTPGTNGVSSFKSQVFKRSNTTPATPSGGSYANPVPPGWSDGTPSGEQIMWMSTRVFTNTGGSPQQGVWTTPQSMTDTSTIDNAFSSVAIPGVPDTSPQNWHNADQATENDIWMATRTKSNGVWSDWAIVKTKGEKGEQGERGLQGLQGADGQDGIPGTPGEDGKTSYTHIAYADTSTGGGFSQSPTGKAYIGMYVDFTQADSSTPSKYAWSLIKGADGTQGIPGTPGEDGQTPYFHVAYANNSTGTSGFSTTVSANKLYLGQYTDYTQADSTDPSKYSWTLIKGEKGDKGDQGVQGSTGIPGQDGASLFTWLKYADTPTSGMSDSPTGKKYMGIAYNKTTVTESSNYSDYQWSLIEGQQGDQGIPGVPGDDGTTTYTWVKYGTSASGAGMSDSPAGKTYIGLAFNKTTATESNTPSDYQWSLIQGPKGDQGIQGSAGTPGQDGASLYTWVKYADTSTGGGISNSPTGKKYVGFAYNKTTQTESNTPSDYTWALIEGPQGIPGSDGTDGQTLYTWLKYATTPTTGMSDNPSGKAYMGLAYNKTTATESTSYADYSWSLILGPKGDDGADGQDGAQGNYVEHRFAVNGSPTSAPTISKTSPAPAGWTIAQPSRGLLQYIWMTTATKTAAGALVVNWSTPTLLSGAQGDNGPSLTPRGLWSPTKQYKGNELTVDVVKYTNNQWYIARWDKGNIPVGTLPTNTTYWNPFGANFESVATGVFFAEKATINNLLVQVLETVLQARSDPNNPSSPLIDVTHIVIDGNNPNNQPFLMYDKDGNQVMVMTVLPEVKYGDTVVTPSRTGIRMNEGGNMTSGVAEISTAGFYTNAGSQAIFGIPPGPQSNAGVVSQLQKRLTTDSPELFGYAISAAIAGIDSTTDSDGNSRSYGGYFNTGFIGATHFGAKRITSSGSYYLGNSDTFVSVSGSGAIIYLPENPKPGRYIMIKEVGNIINLSINGNGKLIFADTGSAISSMALDGVGAKMATLWFDGVYWIAGRSNFI